MLEFSVKIAGAEQLQVRLRQIPIRDWSEAWPGVTARLSQMLANQFSSEGASGSGGKWTELSEEYAKRKAKKHPAGLILQASGRLRESLVPESGDTIHERWPEKLRWGTSLTYAAYHQTGTRKMPARRIFDFIDPDDRDAMRSIFMDAVNDILRRMGFKILGGG